MMTNDQSSVTISASGAAMFTGPDGVGLFRAIALRSGLKMYAKCGMKPNRAWTPTVMLKMATSITGKTYKRGHYEQAVADLHVWIETMKSAIPIITEMERKT